MNPEDCDHDNVTSERERIERPEQSYAGGIVGTCDDCEAPMTLTGDEDDEGHPTWSVADDWTDAEILQVAHQSGLL